MNTQTVKAHTLKIGDILVTTEGYEDKRVFFLQVFSATKRSVKVLGIGKKVIGPINVFDETVIPDTGKKRIPDGTERFHRVYKNRITFDSFHLADKWDGEPVHQCRYTC